jgi:hypothetical protein
MGQTLLIALIIVKTVHFHILMSDILYTTRHDGNKEVQDKFALDMTR